MLRRGLLIGGFLVLAAIAVAGWARKPVAVMPSSLDQSGMPAAASSTNLPMAASSTNCGPATVNPNYLTPVAYQAPVAYTPVVYRQPVQTRYVTRYVSRTPTRVLVRKRPFSHSLAIVAGSSAGGAAIGALAGGGKGAAIGALAGGAGGFLYDRLTHKKYEYR